MGPGSRVPLQLCAQNKVCVGARFGHSATTDEADLCISPWRPSLPVIHLATALQLLLHLGDPQIGPIGYEALLLGRGVIELVIRTAEYHRVLFTQCRSLRLDPESLIRIRLP
jgi:hypothetical protein